MDVTSLDETIDDFLHSTLHKGVFPDTEFVNAELKTLNPCLPGLCRNHPFWKEACQLTKVFCKELQDRNIKCGSLVILTVPDSPITRVAFTGVTLKKPLVQTLMPALIEDDRVSFDIEGPEALPKVTTLHHVFLDWLEVMQGKLTQIDVEHWHYTPMLSELHELTVNMESVKDNFAVTTTRQAADRKPPVRLPFGLTTRKPRTSKRKRAAAQNSAVCAVDSSTPFGNDSDKDSGSSSSVSDHNKTDLTTQENVASDLENDIEPISEVMNSEVKESKELAAEIQKSQETQERLKEELSSTPATSKTFFSKKLGLGKGEIAPTKNSKCRGCKKHIAKDTVRFEWWWNKMKPNSYTHPDCIALLCADSSWLRSDAIKVLKDVSQSSSSSSGSSSAICMEAMRIVNVLSR